MLIGNLHKRIWECRRSNKLTLPALVERGITKKVSWEKNLEGYVRLTAETEEIMGRKSSSWKYMMV